MYTIMLCLCVSLVLCVLGLMFDSSVHLVGAMVGVLLANVAKDLYQIKKHLGV